MGRKSKLLLSSSDDDDDDRPPLKKSRGNDDNEEEWARQFVNACGNDVGAALSVLFGESSDSGSDSGSLPTQRKSEVPKQDGAQKRGNGRKGSLTNANASKSSPKHGRGSAKLGKGSAKHGKGSPASLDRVKRDKERSKEDNSVAKNEKEKEAKPAKKRQKVMFPPFDPNKKGTIPRKPPNDRRTPAPRHIFSTPQRVSTPQSEELLRAQRQRRQRNGGGMLHKVDQKVREHTRDEQQKQLQRKEEERLIEEWLRKEEHERRRVEREMQMLQEARERLVQTFRQLSFNQLMEQRGALLEGYAPMYTSPIAAQEQLEHISTEMRRREEEEQREREAAATATAARERAAEEEQQRQLEEIAAQEKATSAWQPFGEDAFEAGSTSMADLMPSSASGEKRSIDDRVAMLGSLALDRVPGGLSSAFRGT